MLYFPLFLLVFRISFVVVVVAIVVLICSTLCCTTNDTPAQRLLYSMSKIHLFERRGWRRILLSAKLSILANNQSECQRLSNKKSNNKFSKRRHHHYTLNVACRLCSATEKKTLHTQTMEATGISIHHTIVDCKCSLFVFFVEE